MHIASKNGYIDIVNCLLDRGVDINIVTNDGYTALYIAARFGHIDIVRILLDKGADIDKVDRFDETVLHIAAQNEYIDVLKLLLINGSSNTSIKNYLGFTVLDLVLNNYKIALVNNFSEEVVNKSLDMLVLLAKYTNLDECSYLTEREKDCLSIIKNLQEPEVCNLEDETCLICCDKINGEVYKLSCGHNYHKHCLLNWILRGEYDSCLKCPLCRRQLKN